VKLIHPELIIEFLVPEIGRGTEKPYPLPELSMNAQRLRFLGLLEDNTIIVNFNGLRIKLPHPVNFGLHKLIVSPRRKDKRETKKDIGAGLEVLRLCIDNNDKKKLVKLFKSLSLKQQKSITKILETNGAEDILKYYLSNSWAGKKR